MLDDGPESDSRDTSAAPLTSQRVQAMTKHSAEWQSQVFQQGVPLTRMGRRTWRTPSTFFNDGPGRKSRRKIRRYDVRTRCQETGERDDSSARQQTGTSLGDSSQYDGSLKRITCKLFVTPRIYTAALRSVVSWVASPRLAVQVDLT